MELEYLRRLEVECQKLSDAESQIHNYEDYLQQNLQNLEEIKQENQMVSQMVLLLLLLFLLFSLISVSLNLIIKFYSVNKLFRF